jgi:hypothetical protein
MKAIPSNGQVGTPDFISGTARGSIQTSDFKLCFINRIPVMAPISAPVLGGHFLGGVYPSKMGRFAPFLATIQAISKTCVFLFNSFQAIRVFGKARFYFH